LNKLIDEIEPKKYKLKKPIYKFNNMLFHKDMILGEKELNLLKKWNFTSIEVIEIEEKSTEIIKGVTDVVDEKIIQKLKNTNISKIKNIEELETIDFEVDMSNCKVPDDLYLENQVVIPDNFTIYDIVKSNNNAKDVIKNLFDNASVGNEIDSYSVKLMVTNKIEEFKLFSKEIMKSIFIGKDVNFIYQHSINVMLIALAIGKKLGYEEDWLAELGISAMLHDIGMSVIEPSYYITDKKYSFDDYFEIFKHPIVGIDYLTVKVGSKFGGMVSLGVYQHHERIDGSGYPKGKSGLSITEYSKIISICDVFGAMTADRPHRKGVTAIEAFKFIAGNSGILFEKKIVDIFYEVLVENEIMPNSSVESFEIPTNPVLVGDNSSYSKWYICNMLRDCKIPVYAANSKENVIIAADRYNPKVIIIDDSISRYKGIDVIQELKSKENTKRIPIIYSAFNDGKIEIIQALKLGIVDYLKKPYTFDFVIKRILKHIV
jgi:HD-GYP domain-containing protein (c-di-GMP phosphodiesterase class II)/CheY-like chemotaxis protein